MYFLLLSTFPTLACLVGYLFYRKKPYAFQFGLLAAALLAAAGVTEMCVFAFGPEAASADTEIWNGRIAARYSNQVSCEHSYECNCHDSCTTDSKGNQSCTRICQTCYEHDYDVDWGAITTNSEGIYFGRIDRQGLAMPPRYAQTFVGEPTAIEHTFINYFRLATHNVVANFQDGLTGVEVPTYPQGFDLYRVNKLVDPDNILLNSRNDWLHILNNLNSDLGAAKQVNIVVFVTKQSDPRYEFNVQRAWLGGKKNDVIVLIGAPKAPAISWVRVISWSTNSAIKAGLRDDIMGIGTLDQRDLIVDFTRRHVIAEFQRVHMKDQKYLREAWEPSGTTTFVLVLLFAGMAVGGCFAIATLGTADEVL